MERKSIIFMTNSDYGQSNVVLAASYELLLKDEVDIHIASWNPLKPRVELLSKQTAADNPHLTITPIKFHTLPLRSMFETWLENPKNSKADFPHPPGRHGLKRSSRIVCESLGGWGPEGHMEIYHWCRELAERVRPALIVLDPLLGPAHDMVRKEGWKHAVLSPCSLSTGLTMSQPWLKGLWKYPGIQTGFPYPVPWTKIPENIFCTLHMIRVVFSAPMKALNAIRRANGITGILRSLDPYVEHTPHISPSLPSIDLPMTIPSNVSYIGPILLPVQPVSIIDPELDEWLKKRPTVLISLGTLHEARADQIREMAVGLRLVFDRRPDVQVLWKIKLEKINQEDGEGMLESLLGEEIKDGRVRVESWLKPDPFAILQTGNIVCSVNHGGANTWFESCWAGVPQVVLSMWLDTFEYGTRVEYVGNGVYGNNIASRVPVDADNYVAPPMMEANEFGSAVLKCVGAEKGGYNPIAERAREVGGICKRSGGRAVAASMLTDLALEEV